MSAFWNGTARSLNGYQAVKSYSYDQKTILGFSHTHLSGTGPFTKTHYNNVLIIPTVGDLEVLPGVVKELNSNAKRRLKERLDNMSDEDRQLCSEISEEEHQKQRRSMLNEEKLQIIDENNQAVMIGDHATSVIVDSYMKGIRDFDIEKAYEAMRKNAMEPGEKPSSRYGLDYYMDLKYIPAEKVRESVSVTLEDAYDDWCLAELARGSGWIQGKPEDGKTGYTRSKRTF